MPRRRAARILPAGCALALSLLLTATLGSVTRAAASDEPQPPAPAESPAPPEPSERYLADVPYIGDFPDPAVLVDGGRYVASSTSLGPTNLPVMTSPDLETWTPRPPLPDARDYGHSSRYNEPMVVKPRWAALRYQHQAVEVMSQWAPSLARLQGRYVAAYSAAIVLSPRKSCIGIATSPTAIGMYLPASPGPLVCYGPAKLGAIDPEIFVDPRTRKPWLLWKNEGVVKKHPPRLMARQLTAAGTAFAPGSKPVVLTTVTQRWESGVVENPSMFVQRGRYYLLYSGNHWRTAGYATGYAVCSGPAGPCRKPEKKPILVSGGGTAGPGGADAFVDLQGRLRFAYAAWDADRVGGVRNPRRLHVGALAVRGDGRLVVTGR